MFSRIDLFLIAIMPHEPKFFVMRLKFFFNKVFFIHMIKYWNIFESSM